MTQSKRDSFIEANVSTWLGFAGSFLITLACNAWLIPVAGVFWTTTVTVALCTVWSLVRGYSVRRYFEMRQAKMRYAKPWR